MQWLSYKEKIKDLSERIVQCQKPIRILNAIKIPTDIERAFRDSKYKEIPPLSPEHYSVSALGFDPAVKSAELLEISREIETQIGASDDVGQLLLQFVEQYNSVIEMLRHRGTPHFYQHSRTLYGSPQDTFRSDTNTVFDMSKLLYSILTGIKNTLEIPDSEKTLDAQSVVNILNQSFTEYFGSTTVEAVISDGVVADAAAGGDKVKIRADAMFSRRDVNIFEVHEGWVHVGTTVNGRSQPVARWLSVGPPRCTSTQEGLAVLMEIFTFRTSVRRAQRINDRIIGIAKVEAGASLVDIFEYFRTEGYEEEECLTNSLRIFRGSPLTGGSPFTKDISYCKGFVENYNFMRAAIKANKPFLIPFLFVGKVHVEDIPLLYRLHKEGIVIAPKFLPHHFADINGIAVWMSFSSFFNKVDLRKVQSDYNRLFRRYI